MKNLENLLKVSKCGMLLGGKVQWNNWQRIYYRK